MVDQQGIESILAVDIGTYWTHAALIDIVEGEYRLIAKADSPSTLEPPENNVIVGVRRAVEGISEITERPLLNFLGELITPERADGSGVDSTIVTTSAAPPLRVVVAGLTHDLSVETALRCANYSCSTVVDVLVLDEIHEPQTQKRLLALHEDPPDVILITGGVDMGPVVPLLEISRLLAATFAGLVEERKPKFLFAGNQDARRPVAEAIAGRMELRVVDNLRPTLQTESITEARRELQKIYREVKIKRLPGFTDLQRWCGPRYRYTAESFEAILHFLARRYRLEEGILGVDVGAASTHIIAIDQDHPVSKIIHNLGVRKGLGRITEGTGLYDLLGWVPTILRPGDARVRLANMELRPNTLSQDRKDLWLEHAAAREAIEQVLTPMRDDLPGLAPAPGLMPSYDLILARGGLFAYAPHPGVVALTLINAIQPVGACRLVLDWASLLPQLGALAYFVPLAAAQVLERDALLELGTVIAPVGKAKEGQTALRLRINYENGTSASLHVPFGAIQRIPLRPDQRATLELRPSRKFDIGLGRKGLGGQITVKGSALGIIIDARGRPLSMPTDWRERLAKIQQWFRALQS